MFVGWRNNSYPSPRIRSGERVWVLRLAIGQGRSTSSVSYLIWKSFMRRFELLLVILLAAALRFLVVLVWSPDLSGDALDYDRLARSLAEGRGYVNAMGQPTSWRPPLYPAFVAAGYAFTDRSMH